MVTPISSLISSGGLSICCTTAEPSKQVTSSSLDRNGHILQFPAGCLGLLQSFSQLV
jgi:hypothetical protein